MPEEMREKLLQGLVEAMAEQSDDDPVWKACRERLSLYPQDVQDDFERRVREERERRDQA